jgi:glycerol-3-phosphate dehydrogenase
MTGHHHPDHASFVHRWASIAILKPPRQDRQADPFAPASSAVDRPTTAHHDDRGVPTVTGGELTALGKLARTEMQELSHSLADRRIAAAEWRDGDWCTRWSVG